MIESTDRDGDPHGTVRNVVFVVLDTARARSVDERTMPTLSALASAGTHVENAFASAPWTVPSHASFFTGTYPAEHGAHGGHPALDDSLRTLAEAFSDAGYETVGVSNNTWITEEFGFDRGFDELRRGWQFLQSDVDMGGVVRGEHLGEKLEAARERLFEGNPLINLANVLYSEWFQSADDGADRTIRWIEHWLDRRGEEPFFLFCNLIEPHVEYDPPTAYAERYLPAGTYDEAVAIRQDPRAYDVGEYAIDEDEFALLRGLYLGALTYVDDQLATLRDTLEAAGVWEDTLFVVCGDHGENVGEYGFFGHQYNLYDTLIHVPLVLHGGPFTDGARHTDLVQLLDLPKTLLETVGIDDSLRDQGHGRSFHPDSSTPPRECVFAEYVAPQPSIERLEARFGDLPARVLAFDRRLNAVRTHEYKYVQGDDGFERLHRLDSDPTEERTVAGEELALLAEARERLEHHVEHLDAPRTPRKGGVSMSESTKQRLADLGYR